MKTSKAEHSIEIIVRTEAGRTSIDLGLDHFNEGQRQFIFNAVANTLKGWAPKFSLVPLETGGLEMKITLDGPNPRTEVNKAVKEELH